MTGREGGPAAGLRQFPISIMPRWRAWMIGLLIVVVVSGCRVDTTVEIVIEGDGSGIVEVRLVADAGAVELLADDISSLDFSDLTLAGWDVAGPVVTRDGIRLVATKPFSRASLLPSILDELIGEDVVVSDVSVERRREFARIGIGPASTDYSFSATINPTPPLEVLGDDALAALLDGEPLGRPLSRIETESGTTFEESLGLTVIVTMPDKASSDTGSVSEETTTWTFDYGETPSKIDASASIDDILPRVWAMVAQLAFVLLAILLLARLTGFVLVKMRVRKGFRRRDIRRRKRRASTKQAEASSPRRRLLHLLVLDIHGVVVQPVDPLEEILIPLITKERPETDPVVIRSLHRQLLLGRSSPEEFWSETGLGPMAQQIETSYLASLRPVQGLHPFLERMAANRLPVAVVGNQPRVWGDWLRRTALMEDSVALWLVSGDVGSVLPEPALLEATRRMLSVDLFDCYYLSSVPEHLDTAADLGMATALFVAGLDDPPDTDHTVIRDLEEILRNRGG